QLLRCSLGDDPAPVDDDDLVGEVLGLCEVVGGQDHGDPTVGQLTDERVDDLSGLRVESGAGFVEEDQTRTTDEGRGECDSLLLPAGETAHGAAGEVVQAQRFGQFVDGQRIAVEGGEVPQHL